MLFSLFEEATAPSSMSTEFEYVCHFGYFLAGIFRRFLAINIFLFSAIWRSDCTKFNVNRIWIFGASVSEFTNSRVPKSWILLRSWSYPQVPSIYYVSSFWGEGSSYRLFNFRVIQLFINLLTFCIQSVLEFQNNFIFKFKFKQFLNILTSYLKFNCFYWLLSCKKDITETIFMFVWKSLKWKEKGQNKLQIPNCVQNFKNLGKTWCGILG